MQIPEIDSDTLILTFTDIKYLPIFNIWYGYFAKLNLSNLLVVSLDEETYADLRSREICTVLCNFRIDDKRTFWEFRLNAIVTIYNTTKKNIIHTDSDCMWLKDVYTLIHDIPYDFIGSIEHGHPRNFSQKYGFVLCNGFFYIKYNERMMQFLTDIINQRIVSTDDQVLFNTYLFKHTKFIHVNPTELIEKEMELQDGTKIALLKESIVDRECYTTETYCFHPWLSAPDISNKIKQLGFKMRMPSKKREVSKKISILPLLRKNR